MSDDSSDPHSTPTLGDQTPSPAQDPKDAPSPIMLPPRPQDPKDAPSPIMLPPRPQDPKDAPSPIMLPPRPQDPKDAPSPIMLPPRPQDPEDAPSPIMLPPRPEEPAPADCCGQGCTPCVYDLYDQEVALWEAECQRIRHGQAVRSDHSEVLSVDKYCQFELIEVGQVTPDAFLYTFAIPAYRCLPMSLAQHLVMRWQTKERTLTRQYTPTTRPSTKGRLQFIIKLYPEGVMSQYIRTWKVGDLVDWRGPFGNFSYKPNSYKRVVMLAAGTGLTPMVQVIQHVLDNEADETWLHLVYCCTDHSAILCRDSLADWVCFWNFSLTLFLSRDSPEKTTSRWFGDNTVYGRLTEADIRVRFGADMDSTLFLVCGTKAFEKDVISYLRALGVNEHNYFKF